MKALWATVVIPCGLLAGCATAPSISVLGAFFPDWLFCIVGAVVVTGLVHKTLRARGLLRQPDEWTLPLAYFALTITLALIGWLIFFKN
ncbi:MAG TPA: YtcA family lipoprotein [Dyella sp.]|uniref:YtcA family lipoprotein n=1 Tax=Dyella sp. TaxID=1869338 RepID=UPI002D77F40F|nr:YtcA family lipoprotein [Dyella sp.]HET6554202.1 YtcA family lipoprotein [Dyella sp.]